MATVIDASLQCIARITGAGRVLILSADKIGMHPMVTIENEYCDGLPSIKHQWQRRAANGVYGDMLRDLSANQRVSIVTSMLPDRSALRRTYESSGVFSSEVYNLGHRSQYVHWYLSVNFAKPANPDPLVMHALVTQVSQQLARGAR